MRMDSDDHNNEPESRIKKGLKIAGVGLGAGAGAIGGALLGPIDRTLAGVVDPKKLRAFNKSWRVSDKYWRSSQDALIHPITKVYRKVRSQIAAPGAKIGIGLGAIAGGLGTYGAYKLGKYLMAPSAQPQRMSESFINNLVAKDSFLRRSVLHPFTPTRAENLAALKYVPLEVPSEHAGKLSRVLKKMTNKAGRTELMQRIPRAVKIGVGAGAIGAAGYGGYKLYKHLKNRNSDNTKVSESFFADPILDATREAIRPYFDAAKRGGKYLKKKWDGDNTKESLALHVLNLQEVFEPGGMASGALKTGYNYLKKKVGPGVAKIAGRMGVRALRVGRTGEGLVQGAGNMALGNIGFGMQQGAQRINNRITGLGESDFNKGNLTEGPIKISNKMFKNALTSRYAKTVAFGKEYPSFQGSYGPSSSIDRVKKGIVKLGNKDEELKRVAKLKKLVNLKTRVGWNVNRAQAQMESSSILANRSLKEYGDYNSYDYANNHPALENPFNRPAPPAPYVPAEAPSNFVRHLKTAGKAALALGVVAGGLGAARAVAGRYGARKGLEAFAKTVSENPNWASPKWGRTSVDKATGEILHSKGAMFANKKEMLDKIFGKAKKMPSYSGEVWRGIKTGVFNPLKTVKGAARDVENMFLGNY